VGRIFLVACVAGKRATPHKAAELYTSPWFEMVRELVSSSGEPWFILSAKHGLVSSDTVIAPYNETLNTMGVACRREWAVRVQGQMNEAMPTADEVVILAGVRYREYLMDYLKGRFAKVSVPMAGLTIGRQLRWLKYAAPI
jgi:uncharacterized protein DUF6884